MRPGRLALTALGAAAGAGFAYQALAARRDRERLGPPGRLVDMGGRRQHVILRGERGPSVVLESGLASYSVDWHLVQERVARYARVCSYDRPGYGWSDPVAAPRTSAGIASELHALVQRIELPSPYVLIGHSLGALRVRAFAAAYPDEVGGVVLLDGIHESFLAHMPPAITLPFLHARWLRLPLALFVRSGAMRAIARLRPPRMVPYLLSHYPPELRPLLLLPRLWPRYLETVMRESAGMIETMHNLLTAGREKTPPLGDLPLTVISANPAVAAAQYKTYMRLPAAEYIAGWECLQQEQVALSSSSRFIVAEESGHGIIAEQPDLVADAIREMLAVTPGDQRD